VSSYLIGNVTPFTLRLFVPLFTLLADLNVIVIEPMNKNAKQYRTSTDASLASQVVP
jgi:hypothetical protein